MLKSGSQPPYEPVDKNSFGHLLWTIIDGKNTNLKDAAEHLGFDPGEFGKILHGKRYLSWNTYTSKKLDERLAQHYPAQWAQHKNTFYIHIEKFPKGRRFHPREPKDKDSFGYVIWQIIGGKDAYIQDAAKHLGVSGNLLYLITQGQDVSQAWLVKNRWRVRLSMYYPDQWNKHQTAFEFRALKLNPRSRNGSAPHKPKDTKSLGYVIWKIIGGKKANLALAAQQLKTSQRYLGRILHGKANVLPSTIKRKKWQETLARDYPKTWEEYEIEYKRSSCNLRETGITKAITEKRRAAALEWRVAAGALIGKEKIATENILAQLKRSGLSMTAQQRKLKKIIEGHSSIAEREIIRSLILIQKEAEPGTPTYLTASLLIEARM